MGGPGREAPPGDGERTRRELLDGVGHGSVLAGRYRLEDRVRTRPGGALWRAVDETLDRSVLVQAFEAGHPHGAEIVDAARRAALVEDPRLQRVLAAGEERGTAYVVLERLRGRTLVELLGVGPMAAETARRVVGEAAQALDRAAARGLHHLRLGPTSLVVAPDGNVTVVGTAIDAAADGAEPANTTAATRSDAVGLVALLYAALTGRWPGPQEAGLARAPRVAGRPVPPADLVAGVPNDLDTLCAVALGPHEDGPRTPGELAEQLSPWARAIPLTDPRSLQLGGPVRPTPAGALIPAEGQPGEAPARRTPWSLRINRRGRTGPETGPQPVVPLADPVSPRVPAPAPGVTGMSGAAQGASGEGNETRGGAGTARPAWSTVEELRRAVRTGGAAPPLGMPAGPSPGAGLPLAAATPPAGAPLSRAAAPAGAPFADAVPPAGPPIAAPAAAAGAALASATLRAPASPTAPKAGRADADPRSGARDDVRDGIREVVGDEPRELVSEKPLGDVADKPREDVRDRPRDDVGDTARGDVADKPREDVGDEALGRVQDEAPPVPVRKTPGTPKSRRKSTKKRRHAPVDRPPAVPPASADRPPAVPPAVPPAPAVLDPAATVVMTPLDDPATSAPPAHTPPAAMPPAPATPAAMPHAPTPPAPTPPAPTPPAPASPAQMPPAQMPAAGRRDDAVPVGSVPTDRWHGNGRAAGHRLGPGGVQSLEMFATDTGLADPFEPVAPFGPEVPLSRPPRQQAGLVLLIVAILLVVVGVVAFRQLLSFHPAALITPGGGAPATPGGATPAPTPRPAASPSATAGPSPARSPVAIAGVQALDPQGDDSENNDLAARAIDNDTNSAWRSERYDSAQFGGIKAGVGLAVDLGDPVDVSAVTLTAPGSGGIVELRSADSPDFNGSNVVAQGRVGGSGKVVLTPGKAVHTRYLIVWFTRAPLQDNGDHRVIVSEIDVR